MALRFTVTLSFLFAHQGPTAILLFYFDPRRKAKQLRWGAIQINLLDPPEP